MLASVLKSGVNAELRTKAENCVSLSSLVKYSDISFICLLVVGTTKILQN
jgi:hypothetical protein